MKSVIDIDVLGSYNTVKATLPYLVKSAAKHRTDGKTQPANGTGGRIIFVSATLHYAGTPLQSHVSVAKAGVDAMAMSVAIEQGPRGVTSNVIAPGPIADTEGIERLSKKSSREKSYKAVPIGRYGTVKEIADATVYLFSDAGNFVNGETLVGKLCMIPSSALDHLEKNANKIQWMVVSGIQPASRMGSSTPTFCFLEIRWRVWRVARRRSRSCRLPPMRLIEQLFVAQMNFITWLTTGSFRSVLLAISRLLANLEIEEPQQLCLKGRIPNHELWRVRNASTFSRREIN
jgi:hypothetical protein